MNVPSMKFNAQDHPEFFRELSKRVGLYFKENKISRFGNANMVIKTIFMVSLYVVPFSLMMFGAVSGVWLIMGMWVLMGLGMAGIGLSVAHDANHRSYSRIGWVNDFLSALLNLVGAYHQNWRIQHNVLHHSYTNVDGLDEDISTGLLRFSPNQKRKGIHRFQVWYAPFLYGMMTLHWIFSKDLKSVLRYHREKLLQKQGLSLAGTLSTLAANKIGYIILTLVLPIIVVDLPWWQTVLGFLLMQFVCGLFLALVFQTAHVLEETHFFTPSKDGNAENHWAIHQLKTTANFAQKSRIFSWFIGGLNYQIEHHLFPNICHVHYRKLSKIVRETALEFGMPYNQHHTFFSALRSHFSLLNQLGTGSYDRRLALSKA